MNLPVAWCPAAAGQMVCIRRWRPVKASRSSVKTRPWLELIVRSLPSESITPGLSVLRYWPKPVNRRSQDIKTWFVLSFCPDLYCRHSELGTFCSIRTYCHWNHRLHEGLTTKDSLPSIRNYWDLPPEGLTTSHLLGFTGITARRSYHHTFFWLKNHSKISQSNWVKLGIFVFLILTSWKLSKEKTRYIFVLFLSLFSYSYYIWPTLKISPRSETGYFSVSLSDHYSVDTLISKAPFS